MTQFRTHCGIKPRCPALVRGGHAVWWSALALFGAATSAGTLDASEQDVVSVPSGIEVYLQEMLWDRPANGLAYRFRFFSPEFSGENVALEAVQADLDYLCEAYALPRVSSDVGPKPSLIIVSLADKPSEFGVFDTEVVQVFEAYRVENNACIWEAF